MHSYPPIHQIVQIVDESRRTIERSRELIEQSRQLQEQTRQLRLTLEELVLEQHTTAHHLHGKSRRSDSLPSRSAAV